MKQVNWKVTDLSRDTETSFVIKACWSASISDGEYIGRTDGWTKFVRSSEHKDVIAYQNLTEWVLKVLKPEELDSICENLFLQISELKEPTVSVGLPWN